MNELCYELDRSLGQSEIDEQDSERINPIGEKSREAECGRPEFHAVSPA